MTLSVDLFRVTGGSRNRHQVPMSGANLVQGANLNAADKEYCMGRQKASKLFIEMTDKTEKTAGGIETGSKVLKAMAASEAFRKYNWITSAAVMNASGDFRGMVISANARTVYSFASEIGDVVGNIATLAGFAGNLAQSSAHIQQIMHSGNPWGIKTAMVSTQISSAALRAVFGVVPSATHLLALSLQGYCGIADLATGGAFSTPKQCTQKLQSMDGLVKSTFNKATDGDNMYLWINTHLGPR